MNHRITKAAGVVLVIAAISITGVFTAKATTPSNRPFVAVGRATLPEFDVNRNDKILDWEIELEARQPIDVATQIVTFQPGGYSGWHTHQGPYMVPVGTPQSQLRTDRPNPGNCSF